MSQQDISSSSQPQSSQDVLLTDIAKADFKDLKGGGGWRLKDIEEATRNIKSITDIYWDDYPNRVNLKRANADLWDVLSKLEEIQ